MSRNFDTAAEFCELAGTPDLLEYLGLSADGDPAEAQEKLKARRKYMQGMQSNPKYRKEALFLIKHFKTLSNALVDPAAYQVDALRRAESVHLPILEMTVKGVLAGGSLSADQEVYLRRNANELGVSDATFDELLSRLCGEAGVSIPAGTPAPATRPTLPPIPQGDDFYRLLELERGSPLNAIRAAYEAKMAQARSQPSSPDVEARIVRLDLAWSVLSDPRARETYLIAQTRTGPPARQRENVPEIETAPPVRRVGGAPTGQPGPQYSPPGGSRLEVLGEPVRAVSVGSGPTTTRVRIRNGGSETMTGRISCDQPWVTVNPRQIDPALVEQDIELTFQPGGMGGPHATVTLNIVTDRGERASITFEVSKSRAPLYAALATVGLILALGGGALAWSQRGPSELRIEIDPWGREVRFDGQTIGSGSVIRIPKVSGGKHEIEVLQPNFAPLRRAVTPAELDQGLIQIQLEQTRKLNYVPTAKNRRTSISQDEADTVFDQRAKAIDRCIRMAVKPDRVLTGTIRVHIDRDGMAAGIEAQGMHTDDPAVATCLERQAAALMFDPLENGDYATVRYDYTVTASDGP